MRYVKYIDTQFGRLLLAVEGENIVGLGTGNALESDSFTENALVEKAYAQLVEYLEGERQTFDLPLLASGTQFQKKVWQQLCEIPYGEVCSYGDVANHIGCPGGSRAVGQACNKNPIMIFIPCHRVIGASRKLVGFGGGLDMKKKLLDLEKEGNYSE